MITLVLGGARSGKSTVAEGFATELSAGGTRPVTYVATMIADPSDPDLTGRLDRHRSRRDSAWSTVEPPFDLVEVVADTPGVLLVDSLGPWVGLQPDGVDPEPLVAALEARTDPVVLVSDEVGMGVHPETELGRRFRDDLGALNQAVAEVADRCVLVVAGRVLSLDQP